WGNHCAARERAAGVFRKARLCRYIGLSARATAAGHELERARRDRGGDFRYAYSARNARGRGARPRVVHAACVLTDTLTMQVIRYALEQIADEMGYTLVRTGRSTLITEIKDISCVITDAAGATVAQAHHTPSLLAGFEITMREVVKMFSAQALAPGDVI